MAVAVQPAGRTRPGWGGERGAPFVADAHGVDARHAVQGGDVGFGDLGPGFEWNAALCVWEPVVSSQV